MTESPAAFDGIAANYDDAFTATQTGRLQRALVHTYLSAQVLTRPLRVLELNCGTGEDARWLGTMGHQVLATDISAGMVAVAAQKCAGLPQVQLRQASIAGALEMEDGIYDLILSNFGGLNCLSPTEIAALGPLLRARLSPQGRFVAVVMPRRCVWETLYFLAKLQVKKAFRRWGSGPVVANLQDGSRVQTWYYNPGELSRAWADALAPVAQCPIGLFLPPSYLDPLVARRPRLLTRLSRWEQRAKRWAWSASFADHCLLDLRPHP